MGLILKKYVDDDCLLGVWEIAEDYDTLFSAINLCADDRLIVEGFLNYQRKLEWLSVRVLVNLLLERECQIIYNEDHKPFLLGNTYHISISHSRKLTSVLLSRKKQVGIDLEFMSHQIHNISHKFINDNEVITDIEELKRLHLYIHWCAKEALYKICDKVDINFKQNLTIRPFEVLENGQLTGYVHNRNGNETFQMNYFTIDGYVLVWCSK
jgi:4'-phosphopantetheinyl transferase EntD